jgi:acylphosphatase
VNRAVDFVELVANIQGKVQGVGFRAIAKACADRLHLKGFVRNLPDGSVELCAQGPRAQLELFLSQLKTHFPDMAHGAVEFCQPLTTYAEFKILR